MFNDVFHSFKISKMELSKFSIILIQIILFNNCLCNNSMTNSNQSIWATTGYSKTLTPTPIEASCLSYYSYLAKLGSLFTQCVVSYSRPFRVCENCLKYYLEIIDAKKLIKNVKPNRNYVKS
jgi:hypothetical protein